jgi:putative DNA primase/helicase
VQEATRIGGDLLRSAAKDQALDAEKTAGITKLLNRANSLAGINAALELAKSDSRIAAAPGDFDCDPDLLNVLNGVIHLPTQTLRPHDPATRLSRQCPVPYEKSASAPVWDRVLTEVSCNDQDWIDYLQRAMGYTLSGHVVEEIMFFSAGFRSQRKKRSSQRAAANHGHVCDRHPCQCAGGLESRR